MYWANLISCAVIFYQSTITSLYYKNSWKLSFKKYGINCFCSSTITDTPTTKPSPLHFFYGARRSKLLSPEQKSNPAMHADCVHWCLPGARDAWNELLDTYIAFLSWATSVPFSSYSFFFFLLSSCNVQGVLWIQFSQEK